MKRRHFLAYTVASSLLTLATPWWSQAQTGGSVTVQWLGHTCFLFTVPGLRILVNPFQTLGCTAGYRPPQLEADLVLISSRLLDEGAVTEVLGEPKIIWEPGVYEFEGVQFQGIALPHDREGGRRFGNNVAWRWTMGGIKILHLGGAAGAIGVEQKILMGTPDLLLIPVGGSAKAYNPQEALEAIKTLKPKIVIPTHYFTSAADPQNCDLVSVEEFLQLADTMTIQRLNTNQITLSPAGLPATDTIIKVLSEQNLIS